VVDGNDDERSLFARPRPHILAMTRLQACAMMSVWSEQKRVGREDRRMTVSIQVLIVDDQPRARKSLRALLSTWPVLHQLKEAANGREAVELVEEAQPDVVLMDVCMPGMDGLQATRLIKARRPEVKVIVLTMYCEYEAGAMAAGADAFVGKGEPADCLLATLSAVIADLPRCRTVPKEV
jgi:DNA-binding NarL/FixJ family response regulator